METDQVILCIQQKVVLMTNILNATKQIEVRCSQPEIEIGDLLEKRQIYMDRMDKCNPLISKLTDEFTPKEKARMKLLLDGKANEADCSEDELTILQASQQCNDLLQQTIELDKNAKDLMQKKYDQMKVTINEQRKNQSNGSMYTIR